MSTLKKLGYLLAFGAVCFLGGVVLMWTKGQNEKNMSEACEKNLMDVQAWGQREEAVLDLERARAELSRSNYGNVNDILTRARGRLVANPTAVAAIDKAMKSVSAQEATAGADIEEAARVAQAAVGSPGMPGTGTPAPAASASP